MARPVDEAALASAIAGVTSFHKIGEVVAESLCGMEEFSDVKFNCGSLSSLESLEAYTPAMPCIHPWRPQPAACVPGGSCSGTSLCLHPLRPHSQRAWPTAANPGSRRDGFSILTLTRAHAPSATAAMRSRFPSGGALHCEAPVIGEVMVRETTKRSRISRIPRRESSGASMGRHRDRQLEWRSVEKREAKPICHARFGRL